MEILSLFFWIFVFIFSLGFLVKGSDLFTENSEKIGLALKISPFIVGVTIVAIGTSLPEFASSVAAVLKNTTEIVVANVLGSNIFNILVIIGLSAILARGIIIKRSLIDLDLPLLALSTVIFYFFAKDKTINFYEGFLLFFSFLVYLSYTIFYREEEATETNKSFIVFPLKSIKEDKEEKVSISKKVILGWFLGLLLVIFGANYTIESLLKISDILKIAPSVVSAIALAAGTSLPELAVSLVAAKKKKYEICVGNIFGSNVFNGAFIVGTCALLKPLLIDEIIISVGLNFLLATTFLFVISGISQRIHIWEGTMYLLLYTVFLAKLLNFF